MNGAESLVRTLVVNGVNVCFTNPGTSEMHFVAALDKVEGMRCVATVLAALLPENAIVADESVTGGRNLGPFMANAAQHGSRAATLDELADRLKGAFARRGPYLVEVVLPRQ